MSNIWCGHHRLKSWFRRSHKMITFTLPRRFWHSTTNRSGLQHDHKRSTTLEYLVSSRHSCFYTTTNNPIFRSYDKKNMHWNRDGKHSSDNPDSFFLWGWDPNTIKKKQTRIDDYYSKIGYFRLNLTYQFSNWTYS